METDNINDPVLESLKNVPEDKVEDLTESLRKSEERTERYSAFIDRMGPEKRAEVIRRLIKKYNSSEYSEREYSKGYEPRMPLYEVLLDYAIEYCQKCNYRPNKYFPEEQYDIDGRFVISIIYGQGSFISVTEVPEDHVIPHVYREEPVRIFDKDGRLICVTESQETLLDVVCQLNERKITGWYVEQDVGVYKIEKNRVSMQTCNGTGRRFSMGDNLTELLRKVTHIK